MLQQEAEKVDLLERRIQELNDNLNRREAYMQTKEKKWADVENYLLTLYDNNEELFYKMQDLKLTIDYNVTLTNVISENSRLTKKF